MVELFKNTILYYRRLALGELSGYIFTVKYKAWEAGGLQQLQALSWH
jgi:hypothetical protein